MAYTNISSLFTGICDAIRYKGGAAGNINHQDIPNAILNISGGGGGGCDFGVIIYDIPSGGSGNATNSGGDNGGGNNGGGNGGGNNGGGTNYFPTGAFYIGDSFESLNYLFANWAPMYDYNYLNLYPTCGDNVLYMENAYYNTHIIGSPAIGSNVHYANAAYQECYYLFGSVNAPYEAYNGIYASQIFWNCYNLSGSAFVGGLMGWGSFSDCYNLISAEVIDCQGYYGFRNFFVNCSNLHYIIFNNQYNTNNANVLGSSYSYNYYNYFYRTGYDEGGGYGEPGDTNLHIYTYSENDYNYIKTNGFSTKRMFGTDSSITKRSFGTDVILNAGSSTNYIPWNMYENNAWNNTYRELNILKYCESICNFDNGEWGQDVHLYLVN